VKNRSTANNARNSERGNTHVTHIKLCCFKPFVLPITLFGALPEGFNTIRLDMSLKRAR